MQRTLPGLRLGMALLMLPSGCTQPQHEVPAPGLPPMDYQQMLIEARKPPPPPRQPMSDTVPPGMIRIPRTDALVPIATTDEEAMRVLDYTDAELTRKAHHWYVMYRQEGISVLEALAWTLLTVQAIGFSTE